MNLVSRPPQRGNLFREASTPFRRAAWNTWYFLHNRYRRARFWFQLGRRHCAEINPYRVIWIEPHAIRLVAPRDLVTRRRLRTSLLIGGGWPGQTLDLFDETAIARAMHMRFVEGLPWDSLPLLDQVRRGVGLHGS